MTRQTFLAFFPIFGHKKSKFAGTDLICAMNVKIGSWSIEKKTSLLVMSKWSKDVRKIEDHELVILDWWKPKLSIGSIFEFQFTNGTSELDTKAKWIEFNRGRFEIDYETYMKYYKDEYSLEIDQSGLKGIN